MSPDKITELQRKPPLIDWEEIFLGDVLNDMDLDRLNACRELPALAFEDYKHRKTWQAFKGCKTYEELLDVGMDYLCSGSSGMKFVTARNHLYLHALSLMGFDKVDKWKETLPTKYGSSHESIRQRLAAKRLDIRALHEKPVPRFLINGKPVATSGNLVNVIAQAKAGKSAFLGAWLSAAIVQELQLNGVDTLGVTCAPLEGRRIIFIDTEQSPYDHQAHILRAIHRTGSEECPEWLYSYACAGFSAKDLRAALLAAMEDGAASGGIFAVILDGAADLVVNVNDENECNPFVAELHGLAIKYDCPIVSVVHENPATAKNASGKMRGHLGSQLERKAESNLRLLKTDETTVVFSDKQRGAPILQKDGPRFAWCTAQARMVSVVSKEDGVNEVAVGKSHDLAEAVFAHVGSPVLRYSEITKAICEIRKITPSTAEDRFNLMKKHKAIIKNTVTNGWQLATP